MFGVVYSQQQDSLDLGHVSNQVKWHFETKRKRNYAFFREFREFSFTSAFIKKKIIVLDQTEDLANIRAIPTASSGAVIEKQTRKIANIA